MPKHAKNRKNTIQNAKKVIKMSPVTVFTQSLGYNVIFCVFEKGANNILFSIPPTPKRTPKRPPPGYGLPGTPKTRLFGLFTQNLKNGHFLIILTPAGCTAIVENRVFRKNYKKPAP